MADSFIDCSGDRVCWIMLKKRVLCFQVPPLRPGYYAKNYAWLKRYNAQIISTKMTLPPPLVFLVFLLQSPNVYSSLVKP